MKKRVQIFSWLRHAGEMPLIRINSTEEFSEVIKSPSRPYNKNDNLHRQWTGRGRWKKFFGINWFEEKKKCFKGIFKRRQQKNCVHFAVQSTNIQSHSHGLKQNFLCLFFAVLSHFLFHFFCTDINVQQRQNVFLLC